MRTFLLLIAYYLVVTPIGLLSRRVDDPWHAAGTGAPTRTGTRQPRHRLAERCNEGVQPT